MPNTDNNPNTEATKPNTVGAVTRTTLLVVWRRPKVSPERPAAERLNSNIVVIGWLRPEWVPLEEGFVAAPWSDKLRALKTLVYPSMLILMILGSIFFGVATPTESAAVGVAGAMIPAAIKGRLNMSMLKVSGVDTLKATSMILWITLGAKAYVAIFTGLGGADTLLEFIKGLDVDRWLILGAMMLILIFLGTVLDELGIILLTVPVFLPIVRLLGFDELWFGVLYAITIQMGYISPPFGYTLFYIKGTLPPHIGMDMVYRGIIPFFILQFVGFALHGQISSHFFLD